MKLSDLTLIQILGIILVINGALSGAVNELTDLLGPTIAKHVLSVCVIGSGICGGFITMFGGLGTQVKNVLAMPGVEKIAVNGQANSTLATIAMDPHEDKIAPTQAAMDKVTATAAKAVILLALVLGSVFAFPGDASAQGIRVRMPDPLKLNQPAAPTPAARPAATDPLQKLMDDIEKVKTEIVSNTIAALKEADADAATLTNPTDPTSFNDGISHACYPAQIQFLQSLPAVKPIAAPAPYNLIVLFQRKRDLIKQLRAGLPDYLKVG